MGAGAGATHFKVGDAVFGETGVNFGAHAEYVCVAEEGAVLPKLAGLTFEDAALACDGPVTSLLFLKRLAKLEQGQKMPIIGASGSLGTAAVQLARSLGALVTAVCGPSNQELVRELGAHRVVDYTQEDFTRSGDQTTDRGNPACPI